jgi:hypothetical protein
MRTGTPVLAATIGVLLLGIVGLNVAASRFTPGRHDDEEAAKATEAQAKQAKAVDKQTSRLVNMPPDVRVGQPETGKTIVVGWTWTAEVQARPDELANTLNGMREAARMAEVRFVNVDIVPDVAPGVSVNGKKVVDLPDDGILRPAGMMEAVMRALSAPK